MDTFKTSKAMTWNLPLKKLVTPACANSMAFVKPSHGDDPDFKSPIIKRSTFDPHQPQHRTSNMDPVKEFLSLFHVLDYNSSGASM